MKIQEKKSFLQTTVGKTTVLVGLGLLGVAFHEPILVQISDENNSVRSITVRQEINQFIIDNHIDLSGLSGRRR